MRKTLIISFASLGVLLSGCAKWLDVEPTDKILEDRAYQTELGIDNVLNGLYHSMAENNLYGNAFTSGTVDFLAHYYDFPATDAAARGKQTRELYNPYLLGTYQYGNKDVREGYFKPMWESGYKLIAGVNKFIVNVQKSTAISEKTRELMLGEAYGIRAMMHLDIYRLFGPREMSDAVVLPYHDFDAVATVSYDAPKAYLDKVMADLVKAEGLLKATDPVVLVNSVNDRAVDDDDLTSEERFVKTYRNKRMNYWAVEVLKARTHMLLGTTADLDEVVKIANAFFDRDNGAVDYTYSNFNMANMTAKKKAFAWEPSNNSWSLNDTYYDEIIFGPIKIDMTAWWRDYFAMVEPNATTRAILFTNLVENIMGISMDDVEDSGALSRLADKRSLQWMMMGLIPGSVGSVVDNQPYYASDKYSNLWQAAIGGTTDENVLGYKSRDMKGLIRMSELQYMLAEVYVKRGDLPAAAAAVNVVMNVRGCTANDAGPYEKSKQLPTAATATQIWEMLKLEYYREFTMEGQTFFFLKRNNIVPFAGTNVGDTASWVEANWQAPRPDSETDHYSK